MRLGLESIALLLFATATFPQKLEQQTCNQSWRKCRLDTHEP